jgi:hypothetical protein
MGFFCFSGIEYSCQFDQKDLLGADPFSVDKSTNVLIWYIYNMRTFIRISRGIFYQFVSLNIIALYPLSLMPW